MNLAMFLEFFDILGTAAFAVSGATVAMQKRFDLFGVLFLSSITAIGGGMIRDIILGNTPPVALMSPRNLTVALVVGVLVFLWGGRYVKRGAMVIVYSDALGLGAFTALGASLACGLPEHTVFLAAMTGMLTGVGGGMLRDILAGEIPLVLRKQVYATASVIGAVAYYLTYARLGEIASSYACFFLTTGIRIFTVQLRLNMPRASLRKRR